MAQPLRQQSDASHIFGLNVTHDLRDVCFV